MAVDDIGALRHADEGLNHQIVDTFATVAESDQSWTEKIWGSLARVDGTLQVDFGLGKYHNRGIIDGFGGVSRGREQWTVRASRELRSAPEDTGVGPVHYDMGLAVHHFTLQALADLGIDEDLPSGPVTAESERVRAARARLAAD